MKKKALIAVILLVSLTTTTGQTLSLEEIFSIREMDSVALSKFCFEKGFRVKQKKEDNWIYSYSYSSSTNNSIWFIRTFPKDTNGIKYVYYYYTDSKTQKEFKKLIKEKKFKLKGVDSREYGGNVFTHNIYFKDNDKIDLVTEKPMRQKMKYTLITRKKRIN